MTLTRTLRRAVVVVGATALLSGCISLFPKEDPSQLYRFGAIETPGAAATPRSGRGFAVMEQVTAFDRASAGDRILTVNGDEAAYIKGSRWVTSASSMFDSAVAHGFDVSGGPARLLGRGEMSHVDYVLKMDVRRFEARYDHGAQAAPTVVVQVRAALNNSSDRAVVGDRVFSAEVAASDNRVGAIASAYDQAVSKVVGELVGWVNAKGG